MLADGGALALGIALGIVRGEVRTGSDANDGDGVGGDVSDGRGSVLFDSAIAVDATGADDGGVLFSDFSGFWAIAITSAIAPVTPRMGIAIANGFRLGRSARRAPASAATFG